jgi:hypothetical protein
MNAAVKYPQSMLAGAGMELTGDRVDLGDRSRSDALGVRKVHLHRRYLAVIIPTSSSFVSLHGSSSDSLTCEFG